MEKPAIQPHPLGGALSLIAAPTGKPGIIALDAMQADGGQIRQDEINKADVLHGKIEADSPHCEAREKQLAELKDLANSIVKNGLLAAPVVYAIPGGQYRIIAGERRTLASIYAAKHLNHDKEIAVKIYPAKPSQGTIDAIQHAENTHRKNVSLFDSTSWVLRRLDRFQKAHKKNPTGVDIQTLFNIKKTHAYRYKILHDANAERVNKLLVLVREGEITSLKKLCELAENPDANGIEPLNHENGEPGTAAAAPDSAPEPRTHDNTLRFSVDEKARQRFMTACKKQKLDPYDVLRAYIAHYGDQKKLF